MKKLLKGRKLILGSSSPRRAELLSNIDLPFEKRVKSIEEIFPDEMNPYHVPEYLSKLKAEPLLATLKHDEILITSDCVVLMDNQILGKPKSKTEAIVTIQKYSNRSHEVITGVCLTSKDKQVTFSETATVHMLYISQEEAEYYANTGNPMDKAGAYGIQEWIGFSKIHKIEGTFATIMGLPIHRVYQELLVF